MVWFSEKVQFLLWNFTTLARLLRISYETTTRRKNCYLLKFETCVHHEISNMYPERTKKIKRPSKVFLILLFAEERWFCNTFYEGIMSLRLWKTFLNTTVGLHFFFSYSGTVYHAIKAMKKYKFLFSFAESRFPLPNI